MSNRQALYYAFCLGSSAKEVLKGSCSVAKESLGQWVNTSTLTRPILMQYQWYYDPEWERAKNLSQEIKSKNHTPSRKQKKKTGVRHYSSSSKGKPEEEVCN